MGEYGISWMQTAVDMEHNHGFLFPKCSTFMVGFPYLYMLIYCRVAINLNDTTSGTSKWMTMITHGQKCVFFVGYM